MTEPIGIADLSTAIYKALVNTQYALDPLFRPYAKWVMNDDWLQVIKKMADPSGRAYWEEHATHLLGQPFAVTAGGGAPHLEWRE